MQDSKKSLEIFNKSFKTLNQAGINGEEEKEYLSYVNGAKEAYYNNKEQEYLLRLYIILNSTESEYSKILVKRDSINDIIYERIELRKELNITGDDILSKIYNLLERQYDDIINQKDNIENIEYLNNEINNRKDMVNELEKDNQKVEILSLLKEFCIIDTYDTENSSKEKIKTDTTMKSDSKIEEAKEDITTNIEPVQPLTNNDIKKEEPVIPNIVAKTNDEKKVEQPKKQEKVAGNQVISVEDATKINIEAATLKSNNVMKRVGEMLGVKIEKKQPDKPKEEQTKVSPSVPKNESVSSTNTIFDKVESVSTQKPDTNQASIPNFKTNIFESEFNADPETNELENKQSNSTSQQLNENPLFNNNLANTTIDEVMANNNLNNQNENNDKNDFWFPSEETPMDLNSLPDIPVQTSNNNFFGDNNFSSDLEFPNLNMNFNEKEEKHEN